jgi:hypothetical protein
MKRTLPLLFGTIFLAFAAGACEGPEGPAGPEGPQGPQGPEGPQGPAGTLDQTCADCHSADATIVAIQDQYEVSVHGTYASFERDTNPCNTCHTHQGFAAKVMGSTVDDVEQPARINCRTCHQIHTTYQGQDFALATTDPVELMISQTTVNFGTGNLCANCHQGRVPDFIPVVGAGGQSEIPARYGTHHGPQATVFAGGPGLPVFPGAANVENTPFPFHLTFSFTGGDTTSCVGCHMQEPFGAQAGGHTWNMTYVYHGATEVLNDGTCDACHADVNVELAQITAEVQPMLDDLEACLFAEGVIDANGSPNAGAVVDNDLLAAHLIWQTITEDGSHGAHHPRYVPAILSNTSEYLDANYPACAAGP